MKKTLYCLIIATCVGVDLHAQYNVFKDLMASCKEGLPLLFGKLHNEVVSEFEEAFRAVEEYEKDIDCRVSTEWVAADRYIVNYKYACNSKQACDRLHEYMNAFDRFEFRHKCDDVIYGFITGCVSTGFLLLPSKGDGFIAGGLSSFLMPLALLAYRNKKVGHPVPYYAQGFDKYSNFFAFASSNTVGRTILSSGVSTMTFLTGLALLVWVNPPKKH